ncbi:MAG: serine hydrolase [Clostridia bacterium]|nr:serine hydrolase [Clostridia bacterium]
MQRKEFERCTPEAVGIPSGAVEAFVDALEYGGFTQMHGLMIMRRGKVCAEGWWSPFAPGLRHCDHSLSKTYTATAVGIAQREGLLRLTDSVVGFFPEKAPEHPSQRLARMTVRDLLVMGAGMEEEEPDYPKNWLDTLLALPVEHEPGTHWRYNSHVTTTLAAIVERVSGMPMVDYLTPRLFDKIGIDARHVMCSRAGDGVCIGGSGLFTTTEDNLRLMKLYMDGGVWEGERILDEAFVSEATSKRLDTRQAHAHTPWIADNCAGYGYQIWMCRRPGAYRADGAYGQFSVVIPDLEMIVSIHEDGYLGDHMAHSELHMLKGQEGEEAPVHGPQATLNALFDILVPAVQPNPLPQSEGSARLQRRLSALSVPHPAAGKGVDWAQRSFACALEPAGEERISFGLLYGMSKKRKRYPGVSRMEMRMQGGACRLLFEEGGRERTLLIDVMGGRRIGRLFYEEIEESMVAVSGWWEAENRFCMSLLWIETEAENRFAFTFGEGGATIEEWNAAGVFGAQGRKTARYAAAPAGEGTHGKAL